MCVVSKVVLSFCSISSSIGLYLLCNGVAQYASSARYGSIDFFNKFLTICTAPCVSPML